MRIQGPEDVVTDRVIAANHPTQIGSVVLGRYTVEKTLGQGGMGIVVAARHHTLEELHAIKFLLPGTVQSHEVAERFIREARAAARLRNEHVVKVHDVGTTADDQLYMIMEYLDGTTLKALVSQGPLPIDDVVTCILQICDALDEAHTRGIVHRDLKPANLYLRKNSNGSIHVKVLDFGIAKFVGEDITNLTRNSELLGTLPYMSPEQLQDSKRVDPRADIWALGVVIYELLTATKPFQGFNAVDIVGAILNQAPIPPRRFRPDLPQSIENVVLQCLRKNRAERHQTVQALANALKEAVSAREPTCPPPLLPSPLLPPPPPRETLPTIRSAEESRETRNDERPSEVVDGTNPEVRKNERTKILIAVVAALSSLLFMVILLHGAAESHGQVVIPESAQFNAPLVSNVPPESSTQKSADTVSPPPASTSSSAPATQSTSSSQPSPSTTHRGPGPTGKTLGTPAGTTTSPPDSLRAPKKDAPSGKALDKPAGSIKSPSDPGYTIQ